MHTLLDSKTKIGERISLLREKALKSGQVPNPLQLFLEKIYGKTTPEIIDRYSTYSKEWGKFIDID